MKVYVCRVGRNGLRELELIVSPQRGLGMPCARRGTGYTRTEVSEMNDFTCLSLNNSYAWNDGHIGIYLCLYGGLCVSVKARVFVCMH